MFQVTASMKHCLNQRCYLPSRRETEVLTVHKYSPEVNRTNDHFLFTVSSLSPSFLCSLISLHCPSYLSPSYLSPSYLPISTLPYFTSPVLSSLSFSPSLSSIHRRQQPTEQRERPTCDLLTLRFLHAPGTPLVAPHAGQ